MEVDSMEPETSELAQTLASMRDRGVKYLYGRWLIEGGPRVLLFDCGSAMNRLDEWKADLWNIAGIPTPASDTETNDTIIFGYLVAWFLGEVRPRTPIC
jgi:glycogen(starch) synthase